MLIDLLLEKNLIVSFFSIFMRKHDRYLGQRLYLIYAHKKWKHDYYDFHIDNITYEPVAIFCLSSAITKVSLRASYSNTLLLRNTLQLSSGLQWMFELAASERTLQQWCNLIKMRHPKSTFMWCIFSSKTGKKWTF